MWVYLCLGAGGGGWSLSDAVRIGRDLLRGGIYGPEPPINAPNTIMPSTHHMLIIYPHLIIVHNELNSDNCSFIE